MSEWPGIRKRVLDLRTARPDTVFGALGHKFELEEPLSLEELAELERQLGTQLPAGYRSFLLEVAAGGAGPSYGVFPAQRTDGTWRWAGDGADLADLELVRQPFPGPIGSEVVEEVYSTEPDEESFEDIDEFDAAHEAWQEKELEAIWTPARTAGAICICHMGCAEREWLVVTGEARGTIWRDNRVDGGNLAPVMIDGDPATFESWYLHWLSEAETAASHAG
ncbi:hypothetical protein KDL01_00350 [Actinospica durhamensis]|uniref:Knr4/Smi1-like domain-containing protein n=1 Tax=Actinospica durhamensis TaxID=1508375 RepID=A0A941IQV7_9ACTN|nr:SMI1/KNR4 family protein [Actinospica durhamensis]MBR7831686.1 hypothetical protein [Actinospica durhamensis]